jgi:hypothetical protein
VTAVTALAADAPHTENYRELTTDDHMLLVDFEEMNHRCELAVALTRRARNLDRDNAQRAGKIAGQVLRQAVSEMWEARRQYAFPTDRPTPPKKTLLKPLI